VFKFNNKRIKLVREFSANMMKAAVGLVRGDTQRLEAHEKIRRLDICKKCPSDKFNAESLQCSVCTCKGQMLELKASVNLWTCTLGHWDHLPESSIEAPNGYCPSCKAVIEAVDSSGMAECINGHKRKIKLTKENI